jgi:hypothetical protein
MKFDIGGITLKFVDTFQIWYNESDYSIGHFTWRPASVSARRLALWGIPSRGIRRPFGKVNSQIVTNPPELLRYVYISFFVFSALDTLINRVGEDIRVIIYNK